MTIVTTSTTNRIDLTKRIIIKIKEETTLMEDTIIVIVVVVEKEEEVIGKTTITEMEVIVNSIEMMHRNTLNRIKLKKLNQWE